MGLSLKNIDNLNIKLFVLLPTNVAFSICGNQY